jgi:hypothetical protein
MSWELSSSSFSSSSNRFWAGEVFSLFHKIKHFSAEGEPFLSISSLFDLVEGHRNGNLDWKIRRAFAEGVEERSRKKHLDLCTQTHARNNP